MSILNLHFPVRVTAYDKDGVLRTVATLGDLVALANEKAEAEADELSREYVKAAAAIGEGKPAKFVAAKTTYKDPAKTLVIKGTKKPAAKAKGKK